MHIRSPNRPTLRHCWLLPQSQFTSETDVALAAEDINFIRTTTVKFHTNTYGTPNPYVECSVDSRKWMFSNYNALQTVIVLIGPAYIAVSRYVRCLRVCMQR